MPTYEVTEERPDMRAPEGQGGSVDTCDPKRYIHLRPLVLRLETEQEYALVACYACGMRWNEFRRVEPS